MDNISYRKGILWMIFAALNAAFMMAIVRHTSTELSSFQLVFFRSFLAFILFIPWMMKQGKEGMKTPHLKIYSLRAVTGLIAMCIWFYSLSVIPLPVATSMSFTAPLFSAVLAIFFFKEKFGVHRWTAIIVGFMGCLIIIQPGTEAFNPYALIVMGSTVIWALSGIIIKFVTASDTPVKATFYLVSLMAPLSLPLALLDWNPVPTEMYIWLLALAVVANIFQISISYAISSAPFYAILPYDFTRLIFISIIAYIFFSESLDMNTLIGALCIMGGAVYSSYREYRNKKKFSA